MNLYVVTSPSSQYGPLLFLAETECPYDAAYGALGAYAPRAGLFDLKKVEEENGMLTYLAASPGDFENAEEAQKSYHQCQIGDSLVLRVAPASSLLGKLVNARTLMPPETP